MSRIGFAISMLVIVAVAAWAYHVNYQTAEALERVRELRREIAAERERLQVLQVEWAHLRAPERLKRLVAAHNGTLLLMPLAADHFGETAQIPYPPPPPPELEPDVAVEAGEGDADAGRAPPVRGDRLSEVRPSRTALGPSAEPVAARPVSSSPAVPPALAPEDLPLPAPRPEVRR
ncbi:MAG: hypothetical protein ACFBSD_16010 [Paracoccaceae bacterium]